MLEAHTQPTKFIILAAPRSGSNMLCTLLDSHPDILCHHEIFNPDGIFYALNLRRGDFSLGTMFERKRNPLGFLKRVWNVDLGHACVGFKLTHRQEETIFRTVLADTSVKKIILRRKNRIKTFVSWLISQEIGQWEVYRKADLIQERPKVRVDVSDLYENIAFNNAYYAEIEEALSSSNQPFLSVTYELLFSNKERLRILEFLGVALDADDLKVESIKQNSSDLRDLVSNFAELEAMLRGSDLEAELHTLIVSEM